MHAVIINARFDDPSAAMAELEGLVSHISAMPGYVAGYWVATSAQGGTSICVFESEEQARGFESFVRGNSQAGVSTESIAVGAVVAHR